MPYCSCDCARSVSDVQRTVSSLERQVRDLEYDLSAAKRDLLADINHVRDSLPRSPRVYPS